jgi:hypothetical protein
LSTLTLALNLLRYERGSGMVSDGSTLNLNSITLRTDRDWPTVIGSVTMVDGAYVFSPFNIFTGFDVVFGPCKTTRGGRCVGRPMGYDENEACMITVVHGGVLGPCPLFLTVDNYTWIFWLSRMWLWTIWSTTRFFDGRLNRRDFCGATEWQKGGINTCSGN